MYCHKHMFISDIFTSFWALNDGMCGMEDMEPVRSEGKKTESPNDGLPESKILKC